MLIWRKIRLSLLVADDIIVEASGTPDNVLRVLPRFGRAVQQLPVFTLEPHPACPECAILGFDGRWLGYDAIGQGGISFVKTEDPALASRWTVSRPPSNSHLYRLVSGEQAQLVADLDTSEVSLLWSNHRLSSSSNEIIDFQLVDHNADRECIETVSQKYVLYFLEDGEIGSQDLKRSRFLSVGGETAAKTSSLLIELGDRAAHRWWYKIQDVSHPELGGIVGIGHYALAAEDNRIDLIYDGGSDGSRFAAATLFVPTQLGKERFFRRADSDQIIVYRKDRASLFLEKFDARDNQTSFVVQPKRAPPALEDQAAWFWFRNRANPAKALAVDGEGYVVGADVPAANSKVVSDALLWRFENARLVTKRGDGVLGLIHGGAHGGDEILAARKCDEPTRTAALHQNITAAELPGRARAPNTKKLGGIAPNWSASAQSQPDFGNRHVDTSWVYSDAFIRNVVREKAIDLQGDQVRLAGADAGSASQQWDLLFHASGRIPVSPPPRLWLDLFAPPPQETAVVLYNAKSGMAIDWAQELVPLGPFLSFTAYWQVSAETVTAERNTLVPCADGRLLVLKMPRIADAQGRYLGVKSSDGKRRLISADDHRAVGDDFQWQRLSAAAVHKIAKKSAWGVRDWSDFSHAMLQSDAVHPTQKDWKNYFQIYDSWGYPIVLGDDFLEVSPQKNDPNALLFYYDAFGGEKLRYFGASFSFETPTGWVKIAPDGTLRLIRFNDRNYNDESIRQQSIDPRIVIAQCSDGTFAMHFSLESDDPIRCFGIRNLGEKRVLCLQESADDFHVSFPAMDNRPIRTISDEEFLNYTNGLNENPLYWANLIWHLTARLVMKISLPRRISSDPEPNELYSVFKLMRTSPIWEFLKTFSVRRNDGDARWSASFALDALAIVEALHSNGLLWPVAKIAFRYFKCDPAWKSDRALSLESIYGRTVAFLRADLGDGLIDSATISANYREFLYDWGLGLKSVASVPRFLAKTHLLPEKGETANFFGVNFLYRDDWKWFSDVPQDTCPLPGRLVSVALYLANRFEIGNIVGVRCCWQDESGLKRQGALHGRATENRQDIELESGDCITEVRIAITKAKQYTHLWGVEMKTLKGRKFAVGNEVSAAAQVLKGFVTGFCGYYDDQNQYLATLGIVYRKVE